MELLYICLFVVVLLVGIIIGLLVESIKHGDLIESLNEAVNTIRGEAHTPRRISTGSNYSRNISRKQPS